MRASISSRTADTVESAEWRGCTHAEALILATRALPLLDPNNTVYIQSALHNILAAHIRLAAPPEVLEEALANLSEARKSPATRRRNLYRFHRPSFGRRKQTIPDAMLRWAQGCILQSSRFRMTHPQRAERLARRTAACRQHLLAKT